MHRPSRPKYAPPQYRFAAASQPESQLRIDKSGRHALPGWGGALVVQRTRPKKSPRPGTTATVTTLQEVFAD